MRYAQISPEAHSGSMNGEGAESEQEASSLFVAQALSVLECPLAFAEAPRGRQPSASSAGTPGRPGHYLGASGLMVSCSRPGCRGRGPVSRPLSRLALPETGTATPGL